MSIEHFHSDQFQHRPEADVLIPDEAVLAPEIEEWLPLITCEGSNWAVFGVGTGDEAEREASETEETSKNSDKWITVQEAAEFLGISENRIYGIIKENRVRWQRRQTVISFNSLIKYAESRWKLK